MNGFQTQDRSRLTWEVWFKFRLDCAHYEGNDDGGRGLCNDSKNTSDIPQEHGCKRCALPFCHYKGEVDKQVQKQLNKAKDSVPVTVSEEPKREPCKVIDLSTFVSQDSKAYRADFV